MSISDFRSSALLCAAAIQLAGCGGAPASGPWQAAPAAHVDARRTPAKVTPLYGVIYNFKGHVKNDGEQPLSTLVTYKGTLYGTTALGGSTDNGTVFAIPVGSTTESQLYSFGGGADGAAPKAGVSIVNGVVYGTATAGGHTHGTVYSIASGQPTTLYPFKGSRKDGAVPTAGLTYVTSANVFYGTTSSGGTYEQGTVFDITPSGSEIVLHSFGGSSDGAKPKSGLQNVNGTLYGTTLYGGQYGEGTLYMVSLSGTVHVVSSFGGSGGDGYFPESGVTQGAKGTLFGTTDDGGTNGKGTVYEYDVSSHNRKTVYNFKGSPDGAFPLGGLLYRKGVLYGTTSGGGKRGEGTVYKIVLSPRIAETVLHYFPAFSKDGKGPARRLSYQNGMLYGTTKSGGKGNCPGTGGCGTVFAIPP